MILLFASSPPVAMPIQRPDPKAMDMLFARSLGHQVTKLGPSLSSFITKESWGHAISGLVLPNAELSASVSTGMKKASGGLLFTHFGLSRPLCFRAFSASCIRNHHTRGNKNGFSQCRCEKITRTLGKRSARRICKTSDKNRGEHSPVLRAEKVCGSDCEALRDFGKNSNRRLKRGAEEYPTNALCDAYHPRGAPSG